MNDESFKNYPLSLNEIKSEKEFMIIKKKRENLLRKLFINQNYLIKMRSKKNHLKKLENINISLLISL